MINIEFFIENSLDKFLVKQQTPNFNNTEPRFTTEEAKNKQPPTKKISLAKKIKKEDNKQQTLTKFFCKS